MIYHRCACNKNLLNLVVSYGSVSDTICVSYNYGFEQSRAHDCNMQHLDIPMPHNLCKFDYIRLGADVYFLHNDHSQPQPPQLQAKVVIGKGLERGRLSQPPKGTHVACVKPKNMSAFVLSIVTQLFDSILYKQDVLRVSCVMTAYNCIPQSYSNGKSHPWATQLTFPHLL